MGHQQGLDLVTQPLVVSARRLQESRPLLGRADLNARRKIDLSSDIRSSIALTLPRVSLIQVVRNRRVTRAKNRRDSVPASLKSRAEVAIDREFPAQPGPGVRP